MKLSKENLESIKSSGYFVSRDGRSIAELVLTPERTVSFPSMYETVEEAVVEAHRRLLLDLISTAKEEYKDYFAALQKDFMTQKEDYISYVLEDFENLRDVEPSSLLGNYIRLITLEDAEFDMEMQLHIGDKIYTVWRDDEDYDVSEIYALEVLPGDGLSEGILSLTYHSCIDNDMSYTHQSFATFLNKESGAFNRHRESDYDDRRFFTFWNKDAAMEKLNEIQDQSSLLP